MMDGATAWGFWSLAPLVLALVLAFWSRSAAFSLLSGTLLGIVMLGSDPASGLSNLFQASLGNAEFIRISLIVCLIGILFVMLREAGAVSAFAQRMPVKKGSRRGVAATTWGMGFFIIDDYFSPLMTGAVMRPLTDQAGMPREKLAFLLDSTTASVCVLIPFTAWGAYLASLIAAPGGPDLTATQGVEIFVQSIPWNFYSILLIGFALLIALQVIPDYGPMRKAEKRAADTGQLIRPGAQPLVSDGDDAELFKNAGEKSNLIFDLLIPVIILFGTGVATYVMFREVMIVEAFLGAVTWMTLNLAITRRLKNVEHLVGLATKGIQDVVPAMLIVALAYCINAVTQQLGASDVLLTATEGFMTPGLLVASTFLITATISFATGTSWGAFAMMMPIALPLAWGYTGNEIDPLIYQTVAAVAGGGIFGDHASPVSDTSVLSSAGAGCDHMDHVITQLPYALTVAAVTFVLYLLV